MIRTTLFVAVLLTPTLAAQNPPIRVVTLDSSRISPCNGTTPFDFTGPFFDSARSDLLSLANFGPTGTVPRAVQLTAVPSLDLPTLAGADVVLLTRVGSSRVNEVEMMMLNSFVLAGGGLIFFNNDVAATLQDLLGVTPGPSGIGPPAVVSNASSPIVNGPFGALSVSTPLGHHAAGTFSDVGRHGTTALTLGTEDFGVAFTLGAGRVVAFSDEEIFVSMNTGGCAASAYASTARIVFLNSMAYLAPIAGFGFRAQDVVMSAHGNNCNNGGQNTPRLAILGEPIANSHVRIAVTGGLPGAATFLIWGTRRATVTFQGCDLNVGNLLPVTTSLQLAGSSGARPGSATIELQIPSRVTGTLTTQAISLDPQANNGLVWSRGAEVIL